MSEWISIKDRLPDDGQDVIVSDGKLSAFSEYVSPGQFKSIGYPNWVFDNITLWMPIPEPPQNQVC